MTKFFHSILIALSILISTSAFGQTYNMSGGTVNTCAGTFYDPGGATGNYLNNQLITQTFCSNNGDPIVIDFTVFDLENNFDDLTIYDGNSTFSPLIGVFTGTNSPGTITSSGTCLTFVFDSDGSVTDIGWAANISCGTPPPNSNVIISNGSVNTCTGTFYDSGGPTGNYGNSQNFTYTICPDTPGSQVNIDFTSGPFNLENGFDLLTIYDGNTTGAPTLGSYSGAITPGIVQATNGNPSGCLTFVFTTDGSVTQSGWVGTISCFNACQTINSVFNSSNPAPDGNGIIKICQGETVTFNGSGTFSNSGAGATYTWEFGGTGGATANGQSASYTFNDPGGYTANLAITDPDGCSNNNLLNIPIQVSTDPVFVGTSVTLPDICLGETNTLTGVVSTTPEEVICTPPISGLTALPDGSGVSYSTCITVDCFGATQTITDATDIQDICINMEHSFLGDLDIVINCPNGQSAILKAYPGGGGTYLGNPIDDVTSGPGTGFDYCFSMAGNGLLVNGPTVVAGTPAGNSIAAGTYEPVDNFSNLIGCPINGNWCIEITDNLGADDGYIFDWGMDFNPSIIPPDIDFEPTIVSEGWQADPTIINTTGNNITVQPTASGTSCYVYEMTDNFGCTYDTTVCFNVDPAPNVIASPDQTICLGQSANISATGAISYVWDNGVGAGANHAVSPSATTTYTVTGTDANGCTNTDQVTITVVPPPQVQITPTNPTICAGDNITLTASNANNYSWNTGSTNASITVSPGTTTTYTVTGFHIACPSTNASTTVNITPLPVPNFTATGDFCANSNSVNFANTGTVGTNSWSFTSGTPATGAGSPVNGVSFPSTGSYNVTLTTTAGGCTNSITQAININPNPTVTTNSVDPLCNGQTGSVSATASGTIGYSYNWPGLGTGATQNNVPAPGTYTVDVTDGNGCTVSGTATLTEPPALTSTITGTNVSCNAGNDGTATVNIGGGTPGYNYNWSPAPGSGQGTNSIGGLSAQTYTVTVTDANGCIITDSFTPTQPTALTSNMTGTPVSCNGGNDGTATVNAGGGSPGYNYNWTPAPGGGQGTNSVTGLTAQQYTVTITDNNGCIITDTYTPTQPSALAAAITAQDDVTCNGGNNGSITVAGNNGTPGYQYNIGGGNQVSGTFNGLTAGNYTVTVTDANGCTETVSTTITEPAPLTANIAPVAVACNGDCDGQATVTPGGGSGTYTYAWNNATNDNTVTTQANLCAGTYNVIVADANDPTCTVGASVTVTEPPAITINTDNIIAASCGANDGAADITAAGGAGGLNYNWTPAPGAGQGTPNISNSAAGSYTVTVTDANGCSEDHTVNIPNNAAPSLSEDLGSHVDVSCNGGNDGEATVTAIGGTAPYTFSWNPNVSSGTTANGLSAGSYNITVTDVNGCSDVITIIITEPTVINANASVTQNVSCNGGNDGEATVNANGGTGGYNYQWYQGTPPGTTIGGATGQNLTGQPAGDYYVEVTDANGCVQNSTTITITEPSPINISSTSTDVLCNGGNDGTIDITVNGGTPNYSYAWTGPNGFTSTIDDPSSLEAGNYSLTVTDANGCSETHSITINEPDLLTVNTNGIDANCGQSDGSANANANDGTPGYTYNWYDDIGLTNNIGSGANLNNLAAGTYYVEVTDANGCTVDGSIVINDIAGPTVSADFISDATGPGNCDGSAEATITGGTGPFTYSWNNGETTQTATGLCAGSNCVTITDANGCTANDCVVINEPSSVIVVVTGTDPTCTGACDGTANATASGGVPPYTYSWSMGPTSNNVVGQCAGTYTVTVTDQNGNIGTGNITLTNPPAINITNISNTDVDCFGNSTGSISSTATGGTGTLTYVWTDGGGNVVGSTANQTGLPAGTYTLTVTDDNGCTETASITINEPIQLTATINANDANCGQNDGNATVVVNGGSPGYTYSWTSGGTTDTENNLVAGTYTVTITDNNGCTVDESVTINDIPAGTANATVNSNVTCFGDCDGEATVIMTGGTAPFNYTWTSGNTPNQATTDGLCAGTFNVTVTDANGCSDNASISITEPSVLSLNTSGVDVTCFGGNDGEATANISGGTPNYNIVWTEQSSGNVIGNTATINGLNAGTYCVNITDDNGCTINDCITLTEPNQIIATTSSTQSNCGQDDGVLTIDNIVGGSGNYPTQEWTDGGGNVINNPGDVFAGSYTLTVVDDNGCTATFTQNVGNAAGPILTNNGSTNVSCFGACDATAGVTVSGGVGPYTYNWVPYSGPDQGLANVTQVCAGNITVTVTDANGCSENLTFNITEPNVLGINITNTVDVSGNGLSDGSITTNTTGGTAGYTYQWFNGTPPANPMGNTTPDLTNIPSGDYCVIVTDANGCSDTACATINEPNAINTNLTFTPVDCNGNTNGTATVVASGGVPAYNYEWFIGTPPTGTSTGQTGTTAINLGAGTYYVVVTDQNGVTHTSNTINVTEPSPLSANASITSNYNGEQISCEGACDGQATVAVTGGTANFNYDWGASAGNQNTVNANNLCAGSHTVTVMDANGCTTSDNIIITEPLSLIISLVGVDPNCFGSCDGTINANVDEGTPSYSFQWDDPGLSTTQNLSGLCEGTYTLTVTDANGCTASESITLTDPIALTLTGSTIGSNCGLPDGSATVTIASGAGPFSYQWDANAGNQTTPTASNLTNGCYDVTVTDGKGCQTTLNICVNDLGAPSATLLNQTNVSCNGGNDGFAQIQVNGGQAPYSYQWLNGLGNPIGQTTASAFNLTAGAYTGQFIDDNGCTGTVNVNITEPAVLNAAITSQNDVTCFNGNDGSATVTITGGVGPFTYSWNDPGNQTTQQATNLPQGNFSVIVTDDNGCTITENVTINEPDEIIISTTSGNAFCNTPSGNTTVSIDAGGIAPFNYQWDAAAGNQTTATANNLTPGTYTITVTDASNCTQTATATVGNIPPGNVTISNTTNVLCNGDNNGTATASMAGGTGPFTYEWFTDVGVNTGITGATGNGFGAGNYYVVVTDANGCESTSTVFTISEPDPLTANLADQIASCFQGCDGEAVANPVGGTAPYTYQWNDPLNQTTAVATGLCGANSYDVIVTDNNGCTFTDNIVISQPFPIALDSTVTNANCGQADGQACVTATGGNGGFVITWPNGSNNSCENNLIASTYVVSVEDQKGCVEQISVIVGDDGGPTASIINSVDLSCYQSCDGSATVNMTGGNGTSFNVQWDANANNQTTPTASNLCAGTYTVVLTDDLGCSASNSVQINEPDPIVVNANVDDPSCFGLADGSIDLSYTGGTQPFNFEWLVNGGNIIGTNEDITNLVDGDYTVNITDANNCSATLNYTLTEPAEVEGTITATNVTCNSACDGQLNASGTVGNAPYTYQWDAGTGSQSGNVASNLCPGTYEVTITDSDGCSNVVSETITEPTPLTVNVVNFQNVSCNNTCDAFIEVTANGGTGSYTYSWTGNVSAGAVATNLCSGVYTITVTDQNGCTADALLNITQPQPLSVNSSVTNILCHGNCTGAIQQNITGGTPPYTYLWNDPDFSTTQNLNNLCAGAYEVIITDANGCVLIENYTITQPTPITVSATINDANCGQNNGSICTNVIGGVGPFTYQWNDANTQTTACANNVLAGCYTLTVTDANGCTLDTTLCINDIAAPDANILSTTNITCNGDGDGQIQFGVTGGSGIVNIEWIDPQGNTIPTLSGQLGGSAQLTGTNLNGGCYTLIATDAAGCVGTAIACITNPAPVNSAVVQVNHASCFGSCDGNATVGTSGGVGGFTYNWNNGQTSVQATGLCAGNYSVTVEDANGCSSSTSTVVNQPNPLAFFNVSVNDAVCFNDCNGNATFNVSGGTSPYLYSYEDAGGNLLSTQTIINGLCAGDYTFTVTDANGCTLDTTFTVDEPDIISYNVNPINASCGSCNGIASVTNIIGGSGNYTTVWNLPSPQVGGTATGICPNNWTVTVSDVNGCTFTDNFSIVDQPAPVIDSITSTLPNCNGQSNGTMTVHHSGGTGQISYQWGQSAINQTVQTAVALEAGTHCITIEDDNGCQTTQCSQLLEPAPLNPVPDLDDTICYGETAQVWGSGSGGTPPYTVNWPGLGVNNNSGPVSVQPAVTSTYCFELEDANGCQGGQGCVTITVRPPISADVTPSQDICEGDSITLSAIPSGGDGAPYNMIWSDNYGNNYGGVVSGTEHEINVNPDSTTTYYISITDQCSIDFIDSLTITVNETPSLSASFIGLTEGCPNLSVSVEAQSEPNNQYLFDFDCDGIVDVQGPSNIGSYSFSESGYHDVCIEVITENGCTNSLIFEDSIFVYPTPYADFSPNVNQTTLLNPTIIFNNGSVGGNTYTWDFGDGTIISGPIGGIIPDSIPGEGTYDNPNYTYSDTGTFVITLTVTNEYGCSDVTEEIIQVTGDFVLFAPTAFTPNGDGYNDVFFPQGMGLNSVNKFEMWIFNRWGEQIFETQDYQDPWDGRYKGEIVQDGVYVWYIRLVDGTDVHRYYGHVTLIR